MSLATSRPRAVAIVGPTAAGKSTLALSLARTLARPILCCDSVQIYRGLDVGSAKPSLADRSSVPHFGLDLVDPDQEFSAGQFGHYARTQLDREGPMILCGGTGLYLRALGWSHSGDDDPSRERPRKDDHGVEREQFEAIWIEREAADAGAVHRALLAIDPVTAGQIHPRNVVRAVRALWLCEREGEPISELRRREPPRTLVDLMLVVIDPGVESVDRAIAARCRTMLDAGWIPEVENLRAAGYDARHKSMRSLGYREILEHLAGARSLDETREAIIYATRQYARRQRTYFRHQFRNLLPMEQIVHIPAASLESTRSSTIAAFLDRRPA
ncbi:tRNA (adenosine(37)-N6)-dimethylallyltransferase MiaA [Nannocystaceae bacterium ST9]